MTSIEFLRNKWPSVRERVLDSFSPLSLALPDDVSVSKFFEMLHECELLKYEFKRLTEDVVALCKMAMMAEMKGPAPAKDKNMIVKAYAEIIKQYAAAAIETNIDADKVKKDIEGVKSQLPTLHAMQQNIEDNAKRFNVVACGRRIGKTTYLVRRIVLALLEGKKVGLMVPISKHSVVVWEQLLKAIPASLIETKDTKGGLLRLVTGGKLTIFSADSFNTAENVRGNAFHEFYFDEASLIPNLKAIWEEVVFPALTDYVGITFFTGTPKGKNDFYTLANYKDHNKDWATFTAPIYSNPHMPESEFERLRGEVQTDRFRQEYLGEFIDDGGEVFGPLTYVGEYKESTSFKIGIDLGKAVDFTVVSVFNEFNQQVEMVRWNNMDWNSVVDKIESIVNKYQPNTIVVDNTGLGGPVVDNLERLGMKINRFNFTENSRLQLLERVALLIDNNEVEFLKDPIQLKEFEGFQRFHKNGKVKLLSANKHDDTVFAAALALSVEAPYKYKGVLA